MSPYPILYHDVLDQLELPQVVPKAAEAKVMMPPMLHYEILDLIASTITNTLDRSKILKLPLYPDLRVYEIATVKRRYNF